MNVVILILFQLATLAVGWKVLARWVTRLPALLTVTGSFLLGTLISVPIAYAFSCLFVFTGSPILWGTVGVILLTFGALRFDRMKVGRVSPGEWILIALTLLFSIWLMTKTFHGRGGGQLFVGSNNVFDFGHALGIVRSFSWGSNLPLMSPFQAGLPFFYHFLFYFWDEIYNDYK